MALTKEQQSLLDNFIVKRAYEIDPSLLSAMTGPILNQKEDRHIIDLFTSDQYLKDDYDGYLASFVIVSSEGLPMAFFSLRCGELFEKSTLYKIQLSHNAFVSIGMIMNNPSLPKEQYDEAIMHIQKAMDEGLSIDDFEELPAKKGSIKEDELLEADKDITRVHKVHPAIEIKLFGINASASSYWNSLSLPEDKKMGETLFWTKVVDTIRQMMRLVGCEYVYLFAADNEAEGELVKYYRVRLNFGSDSKMSANKPRFDYKSQFLFQHVKQLFIKQEEFLKNF
jgi:hypothetical protein